MVKHILIATKNAGKAREFKKLFSEKGIEVKTLLDMENTPEIDENGKTFTENALIKAQTLTDLYKIPVLADDSGIVVDYLNGEPGIYSARYAGDHDDEANKKKYGELNPWPRPQLGGRSALLQFLKMKMLQNHVLILLNEKKEII